VQAGPGMLGPAPCQALCICTEESIAVSHGLRDVARAAFAWLLVWGGCMVALWEGGIDWVVGVGVLEADQASLCYNASAP